MEGFAFLEIVFIFVNRKGFVVRRLVIENELGRIRSVGQIVLPFGGQDGGPQMFARTLVFEIRTIAPNAEERGVPGESDAIALGAGDFGFHMAGVTGADTDEVLPVIGLPALADGGAKFALQSFR